MKRVRTLSIALAAVAIAVLAVSSCTNTTEVETTPVTGGTLNTGPGAPTEEPTSEGTTMAEEDYTYVCPEHDDQTAERAADAKCSVCGAYMVADTSEEVEYHCPMHADATQAEPGECDECGGMILIARAIPSDEGAPVADEGTGDDEDDEDDEDAEDEGTS